MSGFRKRSKSVKANETRKMMVGKHNLLHFVLGLTISQRNPRVVNGRSQRSVGMATWCSVKFMTRTRVSSGTTNPNQGDSRGNKRRKSTAPPTTCSETRLQSRQKRIRNKQLRLNAAERGWKEESGAGADRFCLFRRRRNGKLFLVPPGKGVRVVYGCSLENCRSRKATVGSNPTPSASLV